MKDAYVLVDVFGQKGRLESRTLSLNDSILRMEYPYREEYGDGVAVQFTFVKNGLLYTRRVELRKRLPERTLDMKWEVFRDRLRPGQEEEWKLVIKTPQGFPAAAEMLAMMYDASLDRIYSRSQSLSVYYNRYIPYYYWDISNNNGKSYAPYFPVRSWRVPVWHFDYFCSPYNGVAEVLQIVENDAVLCEPTIVGYGATRTKMETGRAVEVKYVPVQVEEGVADVVLSRRLFLSMNRRYSLWPICVLILRKRLSSILSYARMNKERSLFLYHATESDTLEFPRLFPY